LESSKKRTLEGYAYGFVTGLGVGALVVTFYLRSIIDQLYLGNLRVDLYYYGDVMGITLWWLILEFFATFIGLALGILAVRRRFRRAKENREAEQTAI
jgi:hypothetical protein